MLRSSLFYFHHRARSVYGSPGQATHLGTAQINEQTHLYHCPQRFLTIERLQKQERLGRLYGPLVPNLSAAPKLDFLGRIPTDKVAPFLGSIEKTPQNRQTTFSRGSRETFILHPVDPLLDTDRVHLEQAQRAK